MRSTLFVCVILLCLVEWASALTWAQVNTTAYYGQRVRHRISYNKGTQTLCLTGGFSYPGTSTVTNSSDQQSILDGLTKQRIPAADVWISRDGGNTWINTTSNPAFGIRLGHTSLVSYSQTFVIGGQTNIRPDFKKSGYLFQPTNDIYTSTDYVTWTAVANKAQRFTPRYGHAAAFDEDNSIIYVIGGQTSNLTYLNDVWMSSDRGLSWFLKTQPNSKSFPARAGHSSGFIAGSIYVVGGGNAFTEFNDLWRSYDSGSTWQAMTPPPWQARTLHSSFVYGPQIIIIAGCEHTLTRGFLNDVWMSPDAGKTWTKDVAPPFAARAGAAGAIIGNQILLVGGYQVNQSIPISFPDTWTTSLPRNPTNSDGAIVAAIFGIIVLFVGLTYWVWINAKKNGLFGMGKEKWVKDEIQEVQEEEIPEPEPEVVDEEQAPVEQEEDQEAR